jgi:hypothetical protein
MILLLKKIALIIVSVVLLVLLFALSLFGYFNLPGPAPREDVSLGMTFSSRYAEGLGLDWRETYVALLDDVKMRKVRLPVYWDLVENEKGTYDFSDVDWQLAEARKRSAEVILTVGVKVPRWPECHIPIWAKDDKAIREKGMLSLIKATVERYRNDTTIVKWQVENEPFLSFGVCPEFDVNFLDKEVALVKKLDMRPIVLTDSGELSLWYGAASRGDEFGTTLYRDIYSEKVGGYFEYPIGPNFFRFKEKMIRIFTHQKNFMVIELQGEPWASGWIVDVSLEEQARTMNAQRLVENVDYARRVGFHDIYLWGGEWWYWMKVKKNSPAVWETGKELFEKYGEKE